MAEEKVVTTTSTTATPDGKRPRTSIIRRYYPSTSTNYSSTSSTRNLLLTFALLAGITALILYLVYRPSEPRFAVVSAAVYSLNASSPNAVSSSIQFTLVARNPNDRGSILYDQLTAYASYQGQPITPVVRLPPLVQERESTVAVSPVLGGSDVPVSGDVAAGLGLDEKYGVVALRFVLIGKVKYKTGPFRSPWTGLYVRCDVLVGVRRAEMAVGQQVPLIGERSCNVDA